MQPWGERIPVGKDNLLLRECVVKNTDYIEGLVVYAGHESKAMINNGGPRYKRSQLEKRINLDVIWCAIKSGTVPPASRSMTPSPPPSIVSTVSSTAGLAASATPTAVSGPPGSGARPATAWRSATSC